MILVGLTGSIGMGKSTVANHFAAHGDAVIDADALVHELYEGDAVAPVEAAFPGVAKDGKIDRTALAARVFGDLDALRRLEAIVHPMVRSLQEERVAAAQAERRPICVLDIPLLFETGRSEDFDAVVVASAPAEAQRRRVMTRPGMTEERLAAILAKQMPDEEKRRRAHFVIDTGGRIEDGARQVAAVRRALLAVG